MVTFAELFALSRVYPVISIIIASALFILGLRVAATLLKWIFWVLSFIAVIAAIWMFFN